MYAYMYACILGWQLVIMLYVCMYIYICIYIHIYVYIYIDSLLKAKYYCGNYLPSVSYKYIFNNAYCLYSGVAACFNAIYMYVCTYECVNVCINVCMYVSMYVCIYMNKCIKICMYIFRGGSLFQCYIYVRMYV
jgi:hypothetical protein